MRYILALIFLFALNCYAQDAQSVILSLQSKFSETKDFTSSFHQTTSGSIAESNLNLSGKFYYKKKNKFKVELKDVELISNGTTIWNYDRRLNRVVINRIEENQAFLNLDDIINNYPEQCETELLNNTKEKNFFIVRLIPKENNLQFESAKIWIDKNFILTKIEIMDASGSVYFVELTNIELNKNLSGNEFEFTVPEGCKVIDFR